MNNSIHNYQNENYNHNEQVNKFLKDATSYFKQIKNLPIE